LVARDLTLGHPPNALIATLLLRGGELHQQKGTRRTLIGTDLGIRHDCCC
jgi:hypothetical protein